jgi:hypothetical protein
MAFFANNRAWNITLRTAHIAAMGVLLGGHAFDVPRDDLLPALWFTVVTGIALAAVESGGSLIWLHQGRGLATLAKLGLILCVPFFWDYRLPILLAVVVIASVASHMPARFRYYSVLTGEIVRCPGGPGAGQLNEAVQSQREKRVAAYEEDEVVARME